MVLKSTTITGLCEKGSTRLLPVSSFPKIRRAPVFCGKPDPANYLLRSFAAGQPANKAQDQIANERGDNQHKRRKIEIHGAVVDNHALRRKGKPQRNHRAAEAEADKQERREIFKRP